MSILRRQALHAASAELLFLEEDQVLASLGTAFLVPVYAGDDVSARFVLSAHHCVAEVEALGRVDGLRLRFPGATLSVRAIVVTDNYLTGHDFALIELEQVPPGTPLPCAAFELAAGMEDGFLARGCAAGMRTQYANLWGRICGVELARVPGSGDAITMLELSAEQLPYSMVRGLSGAPIAVCPVGAADDHFYIAGLVREVCSRKTETGRFYGTPIEVIAKACESVGLRFQLLPRDTMRQMGKREPQKDPAAPGQPSPESPIEQYHRFLYERWERRVSPLLPERVAVPAVAAHLVIRSSGIPGEPRLATTNRSASLEELLQKPEGFSRLLILGDPGSGKTTLLVMEAGRLAMGSLSGQAKMWPILLSLSEYEAELAKRQDADFYSVFEHLGNRLSIKGLGAAAKNGAHAGRLILLLDGYDEISPQSRDTVLDSVLAPLSESPRNKVIITSRRVGFNPLAGFTTCEILPLDITQQRQILLEICGAEKCALLLRSIAGNSELRELARIPMTLCILGLVERERGDGPYQPLKNRAELLGSAIDILLEGRHRGRAGSQDTELWRVLLAKSSLALHQQVMDCRPQEIFTFSDLEAAVRAADNQGILQTRWGTAKSFLHDTVERAGLLLPIDALGRRYRYLHRSFREYLCALALAQMNEAQREAFFQENLSQPHWAEVFILYAGLASLPSQYVEALLSGPPDLSLRALAEASEVDADLALKILQLEGRSSRDRRAVFQQVEQRLHSAEEFVSLLAAFLRSAGRTVSRFDLYFIRELAGRSGTAAGRRLASQALSVLPTPPAEMFSPLLLAGRSLPYFCDIPAGMFTFGAEQDDPERPPWVPILTSVWTDAFKIGRVPVTNQLYCCFDPAHSAPPEFATEVAPDELAHHPAVDVSWYEAQLFCEWISQVTPGIRLPREAEWEKAASWAPGSPKRRFPWGNHWDPRRLNSWHAGPNRTTPVGTYPTGAAFCGALDMAGNVWEWCADPFLEGQALLDSLRGNSTNTTGLSDSEVGERRVDKGGGWYHDVGVPTTFLRAADDPADRFRHCGFRVVLDLDR